MKDHDRPHADPVHSVIIHKGTSIGATTGTLALEQVFRIIDRFGKELPRTVADNPDYREPPKKAIVLGLGNGKPWPKDPGGERCDAECGIFGIAPCHSWNGHPGAHQHATIPGRFQPMRVTDPVIPVRHLLPDGNEGEGWHQSTLEETLQGMADAVKSRGPTNPALTFFRGRAYDSAGNDLGAIPEYVEATREPGES